MSQVFKPKQPIDPSLGALLAAAGSDMSKYTSVANQKCGFCGASMNIETFLVPRFINGNKELVMIATIWKCPECKHSVET